VEIEEAEFVKDLMGESARAKQGPHSELYCSKSYLYCL